MIDPVADTAAIFEDALAVEATYTPGDGPPAAVRVIPMAPDRIADWRETRIHQASMTFLAPVAALAAPAAGETLAIAAGRFAGTYVIQGAPERDARRLRWRIDVRVEP